MHGSHEPGVLFLFVLGCGHGQKSRRKRRGEGQREDDGATDGKSIGVCHGCHDHAGHASQGEERYEGHRDNQGGGEHGRPDLAGRTGDAFEGRSPAPGEVAEDALHHDHGRVDHDAEVHCAERDEVGLGAGPHHAEECEEKGQWQIERDQQSRAQLAQEEPQHQRNQHHAGDEVLHHGVGGQFDQIGAVVESFDVHAGWQKPVLPDLVDPIVNALDGGERVAPIAHEHDAFHDVRFTVAAHNAQTWGRAHANRGHVAHAKRHTLLRGNRDLLDVTDRTDKSDAAHVEGLLAQGQALPAHVLVGVGDGGLQLCEADIEAAQAIGIHVHVILLGQAAEPHHVDHARHLAELLFQDPVLGGLEIRGGVVLADHLVAIQLADRAPGRELGLHARRQGDEAELIEHSLLRCEVAGVPAEVELHIGQAEERLRAHVFQPRHAHQAGFQRQGDVALDLLGAPALRLRDDLDHRWHRVGIGLDVEVRVRVNADADQGQGGHQHQEGRAHSGRNQSLNHDYIFTESRMAPETTMRSPLARLRSTGRYSLPSSSLTTTGRRSKRRRPSGALPTSTKTTV